MFKMFLNLGWAENNEVRDNIHINYDRFSNKRQKQLPQVLIWSKEKGYYTQNRNTAVTYDSVYSGGKHYQPIR